MQANLDPSEIAKFSALANQWWDANGPMKPLHQLNPLRLQYIQSQVPLNKQRVLDVGCGAGLLAEVLCQQGAMVTGIDMSKEVIQVAKQHAAQSKLHIDYVINDIDTFAAQHPEPFDVITCMELLEHVPEPAQLIASSAALLKPGGIIFFSTLNRSLKSFLMAIIGAEYLLQLLPKGTHQYDKFIKPSELTLWAQKANLRLKGLQGIRYSPLQDTFELSSRIDVNYMACFER